MRWEERGKGKDRVKDKKNKRERTEREIQRDGEKGRKSKDKRGTVVFSSLPSSNKIFLFHLCC